MSLVRCLHGKLGTEDCDECEVIWQEERISEYERHLSLARAKLADAKERLRRDQANNGEHKR